MKRLVTWLGAVAVVTLALGSPACGDSAQGDPGGVDADDGEDGEGSGAVCAADDDCPKGERCNTAIDDGICATLRSVDEGEPCSSDELCGSGLGCVEDECRAPGSAGDACVADEDCRSGECVGAKCVEPGSLSEGDTCGSDPSLCEDALHCFYTSELESSTCQVPRAEGEGCDGFADDVNEDDPRARQCAEGLICSQNSVNAVCLPSCEDQPCPSGSVCVGAAECRSSCSSVEDCADGESCSGEGSPDAFCF